MGRKPTVYKQIEIGDKFGRLTVVDKAENSQDGYTCWLCKCECGNTKIVQTRRLNAGLCQSCGCLAKEHAIQMAKMGQDANRQHTECQVCGNAHYAKGLCRRHYAQFMRGKRICDMEA